jgi:hypothetical protein
MACLTGWSARNRSGLRSPKLPTITDGTDVPALAHALDVPPMRDYLAYFGSRPSSIVAELGFPLGKGLTAAGVGIASIAIIGLYWN